MKSYVRISIKTMLAVIAVAAAIIIFGSSAYAATVKVTNGPCRIRKDASTSSEPISSVDNGKVLDVVGEKTASDGYTWYEVKVEGNTTGYIRADLVSTPEGTVSGSSSSSSSSSDSSKSSSDSSSKKSSDTSSDSSTKKSSESSSDSSSSQAAAEPVPVPEVTETDALTATVQADTVTVRESASTKSNKKGSAKAGQEVSISGQATDSEGKMWYQVSFDGTEGFIRSDFLEVTSTKEAEPAEEEVPVEEEAPVEEAPAVTPDYEVKYEANSEGIEEWFLYDHIQGNKQSINNIHALMEQGQNPQVDTTSEVKTMKIIIIIMAVIMLLLIVGIALLLFRMRDTYEDFDDIDDGYGADEDEDEIEEMDEEEEPDYGRRGASRNVPKKRFGIGGRGRKEYDDYADDDDEDYEEEEVEEEPDYSRPIRRSRTVEPAPRRAERSERSDNSWSSRSLMDIDDDMEFEFLDLDN